MPVEAITCTGCGSGDVQEVKPDTYFCNHCESVFKYLDPTKLTVENAPAFCSCGNKIEVQCNICHKGICRECDMTSKPNREVYLRGDGYRVPVVRVLFEFVSRVGTLHHVCAVCLISEIPATLEFFRSAKVCSSTFCVSPAVASCRCCKYFFCRSCFNSQPHVYSTIISKGIPPDDYHCEVVGCDLEGDVCNVCVEEARADVTPWLHKICETEYRGRLEPGPFDSFRVPYTAYFAGWQAYPGRHYKKGLELEKRHRAEEARVEAITTRYAAELAQRLKARELPISGSCSRRRVPDVSNTEAQMFPWLIWDDGLADAAAPMEQP
jgi:hypothetical protein